MEIKVKIVKLLSMLYTPNLSGLQDYKTLDS